MRAVRALDRFAFSEEPWRMIRSEDVGIRLRAAVWIWARASAAGAIFGTLLVGALLAVWVIAQAL